jgi:hypothetical protein
MLANSKLAAAIAVLIILGFCSLATAEPYHTITVDGLLNDWDPDELVIGDGLGDVRWSGNNDGDKVYVTWDDSLLYIAFTDDAAGGPGSNSGMIYVDVDSDSTTGWDDFSSATTWLRRVTFTGLGIDVYFGEYGDHSGREVHRKDGATDTNITSSCQTAYFSGNHEIGIPWDEVYPGGFPTGATISILGAEPGLCDECGAYDAMPSSTRDADGDSIPDESDPDIAYNAFTDLNQFAVVGIDTIGGGDGVPDNYQTGVPGIDANGNPFEWDYEHVLTVDPKGDDGDPGYTTRDLIAFYYAEISDRLVVRGDLLSIFDGGGDETFLDLYVCFDYAGGGSTGLPNGISGSSPYAWERCLFIDDGDVANAVLFDAPGSARPNSEIKAVSFSEDHDMIEGSIWLPGDFTPSSTVSFYVFTVQDGSTSIADAISAVSTWSSKTAKVAYMHHGNQSLTGTSVFRGSAGDDSGYDEILEVHDIYDLKVNLHFAGTLMMAAEWFDTDFNDWLALGVAAGRYEMIASAFSQHIMPFVYDDMNKWGLETEINLAQHFYSANERVGWVPERVWVTPSGIGACTNDDLTDNWNRAGLRAIILDDSPHGDNVPAGTQRHKMWHMNGTDSLLVFFRDGTFTGNMHSGSDIHDAIIPYFVDFANASDQEQVIVFADDWEVTAEEGKFAEEFPNALEMYRDAIEYIGAHPWVQSVGLSDVITWSVGTPNWIGGNFNVVEGTYGLLGGTGGYGGSNNSWYCNWKDYVPFANGGQGAPAYGGSSGNMKDYEEIWQYTHGNLGAFLGYPYGDNLTELGWYSMMANLYETGWHDGGFIAGWQHKHSAHVKNGNIFAAGADWVASPSAQAEALLTDIDYDGYTELVLRNDKLMAVFDRVGGVARWIFTAEDDVVSGNDMAYWNESSYEYPAGSGNWRDDAGDYSDGTGPFSSGNQTGQLTDSFIGSVDREKSIYEITVDVASGSYAQATIADSAVTKVVRLDFGNKYIDVRYTTVPSDTSQNYMTGGFNPGLLDLMLYGQSNLDRLYTGTYPNPEYAGWKNNSTGTIGAVILGGPDGGGLVHNWDGTAMLSKVDEFIVTQGDHFYIFAGTGSTAELDSLADELTPVGVGDDLVRGASALTGVKLHRAYPNPFGAGSVISYELSMAASGGLPVRTTVAVYDVQGRQVRVLDDGPREAGRYDLRWDGNDGNGAAMPSGVYFVKVESAIGNTVGKIVLAR